MNVLDIFNDDAFSLASLSQKYSEVPHVPGRAGIVAFAGTADPIDTATYAVEIDKQTASLIPMRARGAPATQQTQSKRKLVSFPVPHIPLDDMITADQLLGLRRYGEITVDNVENIIDRQFADMGNSHDLTLENLRLGALMGQIRDADGSVAVDLFTGFGVEQEPEVNFQLTTEATNVVGKCTAVNRTMKKNARMVLPPSAYVHSFCGDAFFDTLMNNPEVKANIRSHEEAAMRLLKDDWSYGQYMIGGIVFENYRGSDDQSANADTSRGGAVGIDTNKARFFWGNTPQIYSEALAPGTFIDTVVQPGLPRYAKTSLDQDGRFVKLLSEQNPLPLCLRPKTLMRAKRS